MRGLGDGDGDWSGNSTDSEHSHISRAQWRMLVIGNVKLIYGNRISLDPPLPQGRDRESCIFNARCTNSSSLTVLN